jgi:thioredoxin reductase (NADPH)
VTELTVLVRQGCHLCDAMLAEMQAVVPGLQLTTTIVDIDRDEKLRARYNEQIPLLLLGEQEVCRYFFDADALRRYIESE